VLDASLNTKITGNNKVTDRGITYEFKKPVTQATGKVYFNITEGYILKSKTRTRVDISYTMEANTPQGKQKGTRFETTENINIVEML
jgi:hypothetical protein